MSNITRLGLPCPSCGSSDAVSGYRDGKAHCHKCQKGYSNSEYLEATDIELPILEESNQEPKTQSSYKIPEGLEFSKDKVRHIDSDILRKYGVRFNSKKDTYFPVRDRSGKQTGSKVCRDTRTDKGKKIIQQDGQVKEAVLFGQHLFPTSGKRLIITEGEYDAMSVYQMLGKRYPVVSVNNGTGTALKDFRRNIDFIEGYNEIIICFDNDKPGQECAREVADIVTPGKAQIVPLVKFKDPNDYLKHGAIKEFVGAFWDKKRVAPDGIINLADIYERLMNRTKIPSIPYPWEGLNEYLDGVRFKELVTLTSGSGMGKSSIIRELEYHFLMNTDENIGILPLEEDPERTTEGIMGIHVNCQLHREKYREEFITSQGQDAYKQAFIDTAGTGRLHVYDHFGSTTSDNIIAKTNYLIKGLGCKIILLDHLSIIVSAQQEDGDERKVIDKIMTELRSLVQETGVAMFLISHLRRVSGDKGHENGAEVTLSHLRGSQSIAQLSDAVIGLERNQQAENNLEANLTRIRVLKSRYTGQTGIATHLYFDNETGRLTEIGGEEEVKEFLAPDVDEF